MRKIIFLITILQLLNHTCWSNPLKVINLKCEQIINPLGIDLPQPMLSWQLQSEERGQYQTAYEIIVATDPNQLIKHKGLIWDTKKVMHSDNINILYTGRKLKSFTRYYWKVRVYNQNQEVSEWSETAWWETSILDSNDWKADWIFDGSQVPQKEIDFYKDIPAPLFRKTFTTKGTISKARLYITGLGYYEASINGQRIGDHYLDPGWTNTDKEILYSTYDVTSQIKPGLNCLGIILGNGFFNPIPMPIFKNLREYLTIGQPCLKAQLRIEYTNGNIETISSDTSWKFSTSPILRNNVYLGEQYDARKEISGWDKETFNDSNWKNAKSVTSAPRGKLKSQLQPAIKIREIIHPKRMTETRPGEFVFDMGQNFAGVARIKVKGAKGTRIVIRYGEDVYSDGSLNVMTSVAGQHKKVWGANREEKGAPQTAWQEDVYILKGEGEEVWMPRFTFHGFRYIEITGWPGRPNLDNVEGIRLCSDLKTTGKFACSNPMLNKLHKVLDYTFLSNVFSVESDCPAREKFGYGGDIVAVSRTFCYFYDMYNFYRKSIHDFTNDQRPSGGITETAPYNGICSAGLGEGSGPIGWQLAFAYLQKQLYEYYGDTRIIEQFYPQLKKQVEFLTASSKNFIIKNCINDHESLDQRIPALFATAHFYHHAILITEFARLIHQDKDEKKYKKLAENIKAAFLKNFVVPSEGKVGRRTPAEQAFALYYGLCNKKDETKIAEQLINAISAHNGHVSSGIFGIPAVFTVLSDWDRNDIAYKMVTQKDFPGWGYMLKSGATTLWETWKYSDNIYSQNHPMFGSIGEWMYQSLGGIKASLPGFKKFIIKPQPAGDLTWTNCCFTSVRGDIESNWKIENGNYTLNVKIPVNTTATIYLPAPFNQIKENGQPIQQDKIIKIKGTTGRYSCLEIGSGNYHFECPSPKENR